MSIFTIGTEAGAVTIESELFTGYSQEAHGILAKMANATEEYKYLVETISETTKLPKGVVSKYFKAKYNEKTAEATELGNVFEQLDGILG